MHNIKDLRNNLEKYKKKLLNRNFNFNINEFERLDSSNRKFISEKKKLEQEKKFFQNQKISLILKSQKKFQKKY